MDETFWQGFCYHFALDYENFMLFFHKWFSIRGITKHFNISTPPTPRICISVPLHNDKRFLLHQLSVDSDLSESSLDEVDVQFEGSLSSISSSSCEDIKVINGGYDIKCSTRVKSRNTPDIVRTIKKKPNRSYDRIFSPKSFTDNEVDPGFFSDVSNYQTRNAFQKIEELQQQFTKMQKDIAELVQNQQLSESSRFDIGPMFRPIMSSSPSIKAAQPVAPPPPCMPPPPPLPSTPIQWKKSANNIKLNSYPTMPDMSEVLKEISTVKLRPIQQNAPNSKSNDFSFNARLPLRSVTKHESIIADALRERFKNIRMLPEDDTSLDSTDEWHDDNNNSHNSWDAYNSQSNMGRQLLRKVDRSQLPTAVTQDLTYYATLNQD